MSATTIVVPCYNEERRLNPFAFLAFIRAQPRCQLLLVNDGSSDSTREVIRDMCRLGGKGVRLLDLPQNSGKAEAVRQGMLCAFSEGVDYVGYWDADLATPLSAIPEFIRVLDRHPQTQVVLGSRLPLLGHRIHRNPRRGQLGRLFAVVASCTLGVPIHDTQCGAKLFRATEKLYAALRAPFLARWIFDVELLARLLRLSGDHFQATLYEFPLEQWADVKGSKLKPADFLKAPGELVRIYWRYLGPMAVRVESLPGAPPTGVLETVPPAPDEVRKAA